MNRRSFILAASATALMSEARAEAATNPGQLLITGFRGTKPGDAEVDMVRRFLEAGICAGVILLQRNCTSPEQIFRLSRSFREAARGLTPIISIDQEGGRVARLDGSNGFLDWASARDMAASGMSDAEMEAYWQERAWEMSEVGINLNYAPVVDLDLNLDNPIIGALGRSYGRDPAVVTRMAEIFIRAHRAQGIKTSLKHFPGHGSSTTDSHTDTADISGSWQEIELAPFANTISAGLADTVMNGHLLHPRFSDERWIPASMSWHSVKSIRELGFRGAIITDDMQMAAVDDIFLPEEAALAAVNAGNTFLIYSNYRNSDRIDTVERVARSLVDNMGRMGPAAVSDQITQARNFRSTLR